MRARGGLLEKAGGHGLGSDGSEGSGEEDDGNVADKEEATAAAECLLFSKMIEMIEMLW